MKKQSKLIFTNARLMAVQAVYAHALTGGDYDALMSAFLMGKTGARVLKDLPAGGEQEIALTPGDADLFTRLVKYVAESEGDLEQSIRSGLSAHIDYKRLDLTFQCILKVALAEFFVNPDLDAPIIINEYVDMTHCFYENSEVKIANGLLNRFAKVMRGDNHA